MILFIVDSPNWTDILQALGAITAALFTLFTLYKLVKKDKNRESEINSLSTIANKLTDMQIESEKRHRASKKPMIEMKFNSDYHNKTINLNFKNTNKNTTIVSCQLTNDYSELKDIIYQQSNIIDTNGQQNFCIILESRKLQFDDILLHIDYTTEEGYVFVQDILIWLKDKQYQHSPSAIIDKENSRIN